ncbi:MAG: SOS response-associated peptidase [Ferrovibrio sp.]|nr:SOS response-associated peptidase [Ferrovibrio sp.]
MCGRFALTVTMEVLGQMFDPAERPNVAPRWNIAPTQQAWVVTQDEASRHLTSMRWGFEGPNGAPLINARAETAATKPTFRDALNLRRCLVPADSFYEWQQLDEKRKQPWRIGMKGGTPFAFAGLWEDAADKTGQPFQRFTILTCAANHYLAPLHERMPVIVAPEDYASWLTPGPPATGLLRAFPDEPMARYRVSDRVNSVKHDDAGCFERLTATTLV